MSTRDRRLAAGKYANQESASERSARIERERAKGSVSGEDLRRAALEVQKTEESRSLARSHRSNARDGQVPGAKSTTAWWSGRG